MDDYKNIKIVFKDNRELVFDANTFGFKNNGFCELELYEGDEFRLVACVSMDEIKYIEFTKEEE